MTQFALRLKQILEERGITQKWLADAANTKEATISRYITGVNKSPQVDILIGIAKALNVSTDYLLGVSEIPRAKYDITSEERILISSFRKASDRDTAVIWQLLDTYMTTTEKGFLKQSQQTDNISKTV